MLMISYRRSILIILLPPIRRHLDTLALERITSIHHIGILHLLQLLIAQFVGLPLAHTVPLRMQIILITYI